MEKSESLNYDSVDSVRAKIEILRKGNKSQKLRNVDYRLDQLKKLRAAFVKYEKEIHKTNEKDLGQKEFMSFYATFSGVKNELDDIISSIYKWTAPRSVDTPSLLAPSKSYVIPEPFGVCMILSAWNSQYLTLIMPLAQAIAAGNVVLAKPSEMAETSAILCEKILAELDPDVVQVCQGGAEVCIELLKNRFDIIVFTGSPQKGVLVARAAAEFLTPCILELGGQNPVIVDKSADINAAATNLVNGRYLLAGQACIAPEYVMVEKEIFDPLIQQLKNTVEKFYGKDPKQSADFSRIINDFHTERLSKLVSDTKGKVIIGGDYDLKEKYVAPTIVAYENIAKLGESPLACSEIFGPILYLAPYTNLDECIDYINSKEKPLSLYYFGKNSKNKDRILNSTSSGAFVTNDCLVQFVNTNLPFGGVGNSGYSAYHGIWGFDNLSHLKPVMERPQRIMGLRYPPYDARKQNLMRFLLSNVTFSQSKFVKVLSYTIIFFIAVYFRSYLTGLCGGLKFTK